jgi:hypothetical protein
MTLRVLKLDKQLNLVTYISYIDLPYIFEYFIYSIRIIDSGISN